MSWTSIAPAAASVDPVSNVLKWILLGVAIVCFCHLRLGHGPHV